MIRVNGLAVELGGRAILDGVSFTLADGDVLGVVGPNGSGKTTLREVAGDLAPDRGSAGLDGATVAYLRQVHLEDGGASVSAVYPHLLAAAAVEPALAAAGQRLPKATGAEADAASVIYADLLDRLGRIASPDVIEEARVALGLRPLNTTTSMDTLSGGELGTLGCPRPRRGATAGTPPRRADELPRP